MKFKDFLTEKESTSVKIIEKIQRGDIPISPKFFLDNFNTKTEFCFRSSKIENINSIYQRQNKKNQVSTFFNFKTPKIFWGAGARYWRGEYTNGESLVAVLRGKVSFKGTSDLWSFPDFAGRKWIYINAIKRYGTDLTGKLNQIQGEAIALFKLELSKVNLKQVQVHVRKTGCDITNNHKTKDRNSDYEYIIGTYIDSMYKSILKHKAGLIEEFKKSLSERAKYNEHICYDYTVERMFLLSDNLNQTKEMYPNVFKYPVEHISSQDLEKTLRKYQKESEKIS